MSIEGKVVFITGAAQGIGQAIAVRLAKDGADLALYDLREDGLQETKSKIEALGRRVIAIGGDVSNKSQLSAAVDRTVEKLGDLNVMINNAGIAGVSPVEDITEEDFDRNININVKGVLNGIQVAAKKFKELDHGGKILAATSIAAHDDRYVRRNEVCQPCPDHRCCPGTWQLWYYGQWVLAGRGGYRTLGAAG